VSESECDGLEWLVYFTSFGDSCYIAVIAPTKEHAEKRAQEFVARRPDVKVDGWNKRVLRVNTTLDARLWRRVREHQHHVSFSRGY
jgi:hypothetical protein